VTTWTPPVAPSHNAPLETKPRILTAEFGDGYSQRAGDGLNAIKRMAQLEFANISNADASTIVSFLETQAGYQAFTYTVPGDSTARKWIAREGWSRVPTGPSTSTVTVKIEQVFDL